jgi:hypothetical protein
VSRRGLVLAFLAIFGLGGGLARSARRAEPIIWLDDEHQAFRESTRTGANIAINGGQHMQ